jgi:hypothetical protein
MENNEDYVVCSRCGGCCCQNIPGAFLPRQLSVEQIVTGVKKKQIQLWNRYGNIVPRPRNSSKDVHTIKPTAYSYGKCIHLGPYRCKLDFESRPHECQGLVPDPHNCKTQRGASIEAIIAAWNKSNKMEQVLRILKIEGV